ncbi:hypothetical protein [Halomonas nitroreducens]|uniref:asparagine synthase (glutamine-hydrolyzing) n=1 Tax=Halomonas nitroreducens TaxID=447425 RepID=A0A431V500_9GAMM|nr:hypothetical protein [Halomonas nitroreducens]RTR05350.1 hypothetical protein EKG36_07130 [Halomonas nitroreducens]
MSGLMGGVHLGAPRRQLELAAASLLHGTHASAQWLPGGGPVELGGLDWTASPGQLSWHDGHGVRLILHGSVILEGRCCDARTLVERYLQRGLDGLLRGEGSHAIVLWDVRQGSLWLFTDPIGSVPLCYAWRHGRLAFAPEAKAVLRLLGETARLDRQSTLQFLMNRYLIGNRTMFEGITRLGPGELLHCQPASGLLERRRYWDLRFESRIQTQNEAVETLDAALACSHRRMLDDLGDHDRYQLFLTGGLDSRGILAYTHRLGHLPARALTWAARDDLPLSDPDLARRLAGAYGVDFDVCRLDGNRWVDHARDWCRISELLCDNASSFASHLQAFDAWQAHQGRFVVLGDQAFGAGPLPGGHDEAIDNILRQARQAARDPLPHLLAASALQETRQCFAGELEALIAAGPNDDPKDIQDYLYFHTYIARWILAPGNFKSPMFSVRRPMLTIGVMEAVSRLAPLWRVDKAAYVALLRQRFPELGAIPVTAVDAGIDWAGLMRQASPLRQALLPRLDPERLAGLPLAEDIDADGLRRFVASFFAGPSVAGDRGSPWQRHLYDLRRRISRSPRLARSVRRIQPLVMRLTGLQAQQRAMAHHQVLMRLALLTLLQDCLEAGDFDGRHGDAGLEERLQAGRVQCLEPRQSA